MESNIIFVKYIWFIQLAEHWTSIPKVADSIPTVVRLTFQPSRCGWTLSRHVPIVLGNFWVTFCVWSNFFRFEQLQATFSFWAIFEQLFTRVQALQYEMFTCDRQLHFLASHEQRPWVQGCFIFCDVIF
jgi:hypothetical protein